MPADSQQMQAMPGAAPVIERDEDGRFAPGQSGNPAGRVAGSRNRATLLAEQFLDNQAALLAQRAVQLALDGDIAALKLCLGRTIAPRRARPSVFALPPFATAADLAPAVAAIAEAAAAGQISTGEACEMAQVVDTFVRAFEAGEFAARLARLEGVNGIAAA